MFAKFQLKPNDYLKDLYLMKKFMLSCFILSTFVLSGCSPKVGSVEWCEMMQKKDKGEWTLQETKDYAKHCLFK